MNVSLLKERVFEREFQFSTARSSGPGGQNVNKVNSKVELRINIHHSQLFSEAEKLLIFNQLAGRINSFGDLIIASQSERTQLKNKAMVVERFFIIVANALTEPEFRKATKPTFASKMKRLDCKRSNALRKQGRRKTRLDD